MGRTLRRLQPVERAPQRVDDPSDQSVSRGNAHPSAGQMSNRAGGQSAGLFKEDGADNVVLQLEHHRATAVFELQNLIHRGGGQSFDPRNPIPD